MQTHTLPARNRVDNRLWAPYSLDSGVCVFLENIGLSEILIVLLGLAVVVAPVVFVMYLIRNGRRQL